MRAITILPQNPNSTRLQDVPEPPEVEGAIFVDMLALGVCGTDREIVAGQYGEAPGRPRASDPRSRVARSRDMRLPDDAICKAGDHLVGIVGHSDPVPCPACATGEWDMCRNGLYTEHGIKGRNGFGAERCRIPPEFAVKVDPALGLQGVLLEPTSVVAKAWDHSDRLWAREARRAALLVTGAGPIGLLAALLGAQRDYQSDVYDLIRRVPKPTRRRARRHLPLG